MKARFFRATIAASLAFAAGCGGDPQATEPEGPPPPPGPLAIRDVQWNPTEVDVGSVVAVAELGGTIAVLADTGATVFSGGVFTASDASVTGWQLGATIPAADGNGIWIAGINKDGEVFRLRASSYFESVSDLYGLTGEPVLDLRALGGAWIAFVVDGGIAIADGMAVTRYDVGSYVPIGGGGGRVATAGEDKVTVFEAATAKLYSYPLPGAEQAIFDAAGKLVVRTGDAIYSENDGGGLVLRHQSDAGPGSVRELAASDVRVWFADGAELGAISGGVVSRTSGAALPGAARLLGSPSGDVWILDGGDLKRAAADTDDTKDRQVWEEDVQPVFLASCTPCHEPGGSAGADLSTYGAWVTLRAKVKDKVIDAKTMPPSGIEFTDADRAIIAEWVAGGAP